MGWTMGYMTEKSNQIEAVEAKQLLSLPAFTSLIVLFCLFFIIGCLMTYHAFQMNQTSDSYNRLIFRSVLSLLRFVVLDIFLSSLWFFLFHFRIGGGEGRKDSSGIFQRRFQNILSTNLWVLFQDSSGVVLRSLWLFLDFEGLFWGRLGFL